MTRAEMLARLQEDRAKCKREMTGLLDAPKKFNRDLSPNEKKRFDELEGMIEGYNERIDELTEQVEAERSAAEYTRTRYPNLRFGDGVTREPDIYRRGGEHSFFRDTYRAHQHGDPDALDRLRRNNAMVADDKARRGEQRAISTTNGAGGEFVPPLWLEEQWIALARPSRVTADLATRQALPGGTDVINIPKVATGTATALQTNQNSAIQQTDMTTTSVSSSVITIAGGQTVSVQLMEQSPLNVDEMILADLAADYAMKLDIEVLTGSGTGGHLTGITTLSGTNSVAWTQASPSLGGTGGMYSALANAIQQIHTNRYAPPTAIIMHPRRWAWAEAQSDTTNRPLVVPTAGNPMNAAGVQTQVAAEGAVGTMLGLPVFVDPNIPTNLGAGTNQDEIIVTRASDQYLWEGQLRAEAFQQTYAQNLSVFVRLYNYAAYIPGRYPKSIGVVTGTGAVTPTF